MTGKKEQAPKKRTRKKLWSHAVGQRPHRVLVFERAKGGVLYLQVWNPVTEKPKRRSLRHSNQERAIEQAEEAAKRLREGVVGLSGPAAVGSVLTLYLTHRTPNKKSAEMRAEDRRRAEMWNRYLGSDKRILQLGRAEWDTFITDRATGAVDARGRRVKKALRVEVEPRTVDADLVFINSAFNWACQWNTPDGRKLLERNPWGAPAAGVKRALERPKTAAPRRPVATYDRYLAMRAVADQVLMQTAKGDPDAELVERSGKKGGVRLNAPSKKPGSAKFWMKPSYLPELLDLVEDNGRRITSVCRLEYDDIAREGGVITRVTWPPLKREKEKSVPVSDRTRAILEEILRRRPGLGKHPVFPAPRNPLKPMTRHLADDWLREAVVISGVGFLDWGMWHPFRRKWATERKHLPRKDVMEVGGWKDERSLRESYEQSDEETMLAVVNEPRKLTEKKA